MASCHTELVHLIHRMSSAAAHNLQHCPSFSPVLMTPLITTLSIHKAKSCRDGKKTGSEQAVGVSEFGEHV